MIHFKSHEEFDRLQDYLCDGGQGRRARWAKPPRPTATFFETRMRLNARFLRCSRDVKAPRAARRELPSGRAGTVIPNNFLASPLTYSNIGI